MSRKKRVFLIFLFSAVNKLSKLLINSVFCNPVRRAIIFYFISIQFFIIFVQTSFTGFNGTPQKIYWIPVQIASCVLVSKLSPTKVTNPIELLLVFNVIFLTVPVIATSFSNEIYGVGRVEVLSVFLVLLNQLILFCLYSILNNRVFHFRLILVNPVRIIQILQYLTLILFIFVGYKLGFNLHPSSFDDLYENREGLQENLLSIDSALLNYSSGWINGLLIPITLSMALFLKKYLSFAISCVFAILIYSQSFNKYVLAAIFFAIILNLIFQPTSFEYITSKRFYSFFTWLIYLGAILKTITSNYNVGDFAIRRVLLDPSVMFQHYVRFSQEYQLNWWRDSRIFGGTSTDVAVSEIVGQRFFNIPEFLVLKSELSMNATAGAAADGIAQGGVFGLVIASIGTFIFFWLLNCLTVGKNRGLALILSAISAHVIMEGTLHTSMLSKGLILIPVLCYLLPVQVQSFGDKFNRRV